MMHLRCQVCAATQSVNTADQEDEDLRTQGIRRSFRAEHLASCGAGSIALILTAEEATVIDPEIWHKYLAFSKPPMDVRHDADGFFSWHGQRVCEDCWQVIPHYVDFPVGLTSPESDGAGGAVPKMRPDTVPTDSPARATAAEHLPKAVCLPCYLAAFRRVYPTADVPEFRAEVAA